MKILESMSPYERITCIIGALNLFIVLLGAVYAVLQLWMLKRTSNENNAWNRKKASFDLVREMSGNDFFNIIDELYQISGVEIVEGSTYSSCIANLSSDKIYQFDRKVTQLLNTFEGITSCIKYGILEKEMCKDHFEYMFKFYFEWSMPYIEKRRKATNDPLIFSEFEEMAQECIKKCSTE